MAVAAIAPETLVWAEDVRKPTNPVLEDDDRNVLRHGRLPSSRIDC